LAGALICTGENIAMYERFTDRARKVMQLAHQEAQRFNHEYIGTEHILLGIIQEGSGVAANVLKNLDVNPRKIRLEIEKIIRSGPNRVIMGKLPQTPKMKKVIEYSIEEARNLSHNFVGTEHLLLGLLREQEGVAAQVLINLGLQFKDVREEVLNLLGHSAAVAMRRQNDLTRFGRMARRAGRCVRAYRTTFVAGLLAPILGGLVGAASGAEGMDVALAVIAAVFYMTGVMASSIDSRLNGKR
jgi:ATP-dependent Clp protease ATP-binding subunit ClpA